MQRRNTFTADQFTDFAAGIQNQNNYFNDRQQQIQDTDRTPGMTYHPGPAARQPSWHVPRQQHRQQEHDAQQSHQPHSHVPNAAKFPNPIQQHKAKQSKTGKVRGKGSRIGEFTIIKTLGKGAFSKVCMAEHQSTKLMFALKFIMAKSPQGGSLEKHNTRIEREVMLLSLLHHPNIVRLYDVMLMPKYTMIVMDYNSGGELLHYIRRRGRLHENEARVFFRQIVSAMDYLHRNCIIHRDLKMENIMLDHENRIRIIDFGFANVFNWDKLLDTFCGSPLYIPPEIVRGIKYTGPEVDIWSMGVLLYFMLCGCMPFESEDRKEVFYKIERGRFYMPPNLSKEAQNLIQHMLTINPRQRITMKGIIEHPWINKGYDQPIDNHLPSRPSVVLQPNEKILQKMCVYKYKPEAVAAALAHSEMAFTPMVCIYHLLEEAQRRKAQRSARQSYNASFDNASGNVSSTATDSGQPQYLPETTHRSVKVNNDLPLDSLYLPSRRRHSHSHGYTYKHDNGYDSGRGFLSDKSHDLAYLPDSGNASQIIKEETIEKEDAEMASKGMHEAEILFEPFLNSTGNSNLDVSNNKPETASNTDWIVPVAAGSLFSVGPAALVIDEESKSASKRSSGPARLFDRVKESMSFLKIKEPHMEETVQPVETPDQAKNNSGRKSRRASLIQSTFRRFSAVP